MTAEPAGKCSFETGVYRPPSEGGSYSLLIRVTRNCPWNRCTFCSMYKQEEYSLRSPQEVNSDIDSMAAICNGLKDFSWKLDYGGEINRAAAIAMINNNPELNASPGFVMIYNWLLSGGKTAFLQDANSLIMKSDQLVDILTHLRKTFPSLNRVTSYARSKAIAQKSAEELKKICTAGLDRLHVGLETGDKALLKKIKKGVTAEGHIKAGKKAMEAGFQLSEYWMPGLGGKAMWESHAGNTARVLNEINPHYIRSRPFFPSPGTPLFKEYDRGEFQPLSPSEQLIELKLMMEELDFTSKVCFDHAGNYWRGKNGRLLFSQSYEGYKFPEQKPVVLKLLEEGIEAQKGIPRAPVLDL
ncbi:MAG: radical SAM protein [Candidatus Desulfatibia sp.]|uniref:radical SAM protein n=1 Tax=Candidatus Desulfatibia sp. TaxID=3101189 RepID=UPI002F34B5EF